MFPEDFSNCSLQQLHDWRTQLLREFQQAQEQAIDSGIDPQALEPILSIGKALGKVEGAIQNYQQ